MAFADSKNKIAVRLEWDMPLIRAWSGAAKRKLSYFGLPGPRMLDLLAWREFLEDRRTAVEENPKSLQKREAADDAAAELLSNALKVNLADGLQILRGDIGNVVIRGFDDYAVRPIRSTGGPAETARFQYDLHNFDFDGGLGFIQKNTGEAPRLDALRKLAERQRGHSFLLLLTINVRNTVGPNIADYLERLRRQGSQGAIEWYLQRGAGEVEHRLKAIVPVLMGQIAQTQGFELRCRPPVAYTGHQQARMVHFAFEFLAEDLVFAGVNHQSIDDILTLPMLEVIDGIICLAPLQHPAFTAQRCRPLLSDFDEDFVAALLS
ncbi:hypothetical protein GOL41_26895 [Sinorhizobium medicae]|nr:hypothetical protein [Sinorhizobium meliloti]MDX0351624.1 hypothetical protein [Sinorhizobium meliloti]MDX0499546.1 hypothetical protein [Sinorhizobium medicae]MDX1053343.1 hypothetical protein [Sinorhizobium medicae]